MRIDKIDYKILFELDHDARQSYSKLAKKVRLSQESVRYRINRLVQSGIIEKFLTILDPSKLGASTYKIFLKLQNINSKKFQEIIDYLQKHHQVIWLAAFDGNHDIGITILVDHILNLNNFYEELNEYFSHNINRMFFSVNVLGEFYPRHYLINKERELLKQYHYSIDKPTSDIDSTDIKIISNLTHDGRVSAVDIARKIGISPDTVLQRKKRLENEKIITKYNIFINHKQLHLIHIKALIHLNNFSPDKVAKFLDFCRIQDHIVYIVKALGQWNYELDFEVDSFDQYRDIMMRITNDFSDIIRDYETLIVRKTYKINFYPFTI